MTDQQFCLRWNNHQSTLVAVFDGLLEKGVLVDCTLAAEGQQLTAHKVVLAACSPFLETLLSRHYDKHPILILKDVKFSELKAMMDYMYRGEVNISQDQLGTFLKAAESLQIKGLSDGGGDKDPYPPTKTARQYERKPLRPTSPLRNSMPPAAGNPATAVPEGKRAAAVPPPAPPLPYLHNSLRNSLKSSPLLVDIPEDNAVRRDGSVSPLPRKKKRTREPEEVNPLNNNVVCKVELEEPMAMAPLTPTPMAARPSPDPAPPRVPSPDAKSDTTLDKTDPVAHLKHELIEEEEDINEDSMELTLDEGDDGEAGPSHNEGDFNDFYGGSQDGDNRDSQEFMPYSNLWHISMKNGTDDKDGKLEDFKGFDARRNEIYRQQQLLRNQRLEADGVKTAGFSCANCGKMYNQQASLWRHSKYECGKGPQFQCPYCALKVTQKCYMRKHILRRHSNEVVTFTQC